MSRTGGSVHDMEYLIAGLLRPSPLHRFRLLFVQFKLSVEHLESRFRILHRTLHGNLPLLTLPIQVLGGSVPYLRELFEDSDRDMPVRGIDRGLGNHAVGTDQSQAECGNGQTRQAHLGIADGYANSVEGGLNLLNRSRVGKGHGGADFWDAEMRHCDKHLSYTSGY